MRLKKIVTGDMSYFLNQNGTRNIDMQHGHFLKTTGNMGTPQPDPQLGMDLYFLFKMSI